MNHLIFTAVLTACLGIGGYQQELGTFGPLPEGLGHNYRYDPGQINSSPTGSWPPLVSPHFTMSIVVYTSLYYVLTYFVGSFGRYNIHTKVFWWLMIIYLVATALIGFQLSNLQPYLLQAVPTMSGYYTSRGQGALQLSFPPCLPTYLTIRWGCLMSRPKMYLTV
ncbi:hypothetical protein DSO57_1015292 [Entomophthora muscae]|uniref:Uncharacterized protein n=1 Tax=Entomophthora muscae TaxID=34485 RepID=A0ACC2SUA5_9FUNG|nr:hypothetical protein DSO57_1015292 [Entomophthora muscae]